MIHNYMEVAKLRDKERMAFVIILTTEFLACSNMQEEEVLHFVNRIPWHVKNMRAEIGWINPKK